MIEDVLEIRIWYFFIFNDYACPYNTVLNTTLYLFNN